MKIKKNVRFESNTVVLEEKLVFSNSDMTALLYLKSGKKIQFWASKSMDTTFTFYRMEMQDLAQYGIVKSSVSDTNNLIIEYSITDKGRDYLRGVIK